MSRRSGTDAPVAPAHSPRAVVHRTQGSKHGPITRLMSPGDLGQALKPFIFLELMDYDAQHGKTHSGMHPHSGIATLTFMAKGDVRYADSTGKAGVLPAGGVEWMQAGRGVWHTGESVGDTPGQGFHLWVALPAALENAPAFSRHLAPSDVPQLGPVRLLLGQYGTARGAVEAPSEMTYLSVTLARGERWHYTPPAGHTVAWAAVASGRLLVMMGTYSVHTSADALAHGEAEIRRIALSLLARSAD